MNAFVAAADILGSRTLEINNQIITRLSLLEQAARIAEDAAPYVHPRLAQIEHTGNDNKRVDVKVTMTLEPNEAYMGDYVALDTRADSIKSWAKRAAFVFLIVVNVVVLDACSRIEIADMKGSPIAQINPMVTAVNIRVGDFADNGKVGLTAVKGVDIGFVKSGGCKRS
jgi:hypothetical protein